MSIDATFWVAIAFFLFFGGLIYLKVPQKINNSLVEKINIIKKELKEAEKIKNEAKTLLSDYEDKLDKSKKESKLISKQPKRKVKKTYQKRQKRFINWLKIKK